jgi:hypothetical protein
MSDKEREKAIEDLKENIDRQIEEKGKEVTRDQNYENLNENSKKEALRSDKNIESLIEQKRAITQYESSKEFFDTYKEIMDSKNRTVDGSVKRSDIEKLQELGVNFDDDIMKSVNDSIKDGKFRIERGEKVRSGIGNWKSLKGNVMDTILGTDVIDKEKEKRVDENVTDELNKSNAVNEFDDIVKRVQENPELKLNQDKIFDSVIETSEVNQAKERQVQDNIDSSLRENENITSDSTKDTSKPDIKDDVGRLSERYQKELEIIDKLKTKGAISKEVYEKQMESIQSNIDKSMQDIKDSMPDSKPANKTIRGENDINERKESEIKDLEETQKKQDEDRKKQREREQREREQREREQREREQRQREQRQREQRQREKARVDVNPRGL